MTLSDIKEGGTYRYNYEGGYIDYQITRVYDQRDNIFYGMVEAKALDAGENRGLFLPEELDTL